jgi:MFS transporter, YNFM family, putative membrane transport protein
MRAGAIRQLQAMAFLSSFDRMVIAPVLPMVAQDLAVPVESAAASATSYFVGYGIMQAGWGLVSDRFGRVATMRLSLMLAGVAACASAFAPSLLALVLLRALTGAGFAAVVPGVLIYLGDTVDARERHAPLTDVMRAMALGMALATVAAAGIAEVASWRVALALPGITALGLAVVARGLSEPAGRRAGRGRLGVVLRHRWALAVVAFAFVEGAVILGALPLLPTLLQSGGTTVIASGAVVAGYGASIVVFARLVKVLTRRTSAAALMGLGATFGVVALGVLVVSRGPWAVLLASVLLAGTWSFMHSTMQAWATDVAPSARAATISIFATMLFLGSAAGTAVGSSLMGAGATAAYFAGSALVLAMLGVVVVRARRRYPG